MATMANGRVSPGEGYTLAFGAGSIQLSQNDKCNSELNAKNREVSGPSVKNFSCSTLLSMKFQLVIKTKMLKNKEFHSF